MIKIIEHRIGQMQHNLIVFWPLMRKLLSPLSSRSLETCGKRLHGFPPLPRRPEYQQFIFPSILNLCKHCLLYKDIIIELTLASSTRNWMVWNGISRKASRSFWIFARSRLRMDNAGGYDHLAWLPYEAKCESWGISKGGGEYCGKNKINPLGEKMNHFYRFWRESCECHLCDEEVESLVQQWIVPGLLSNSACDVVHLNKV